MDDFSWGNTRKVVGEGNKKTVVYEDDEPFNDGIIPYKSFKGESKLWSTSLPAGCVLILRLRIERMGKGVGAL